VKVENLLVIFSPKYTATVERVCGDPMHVSHEILLVMLSL
jgi:hypothetical protein